MTETNEVAGAPALSEAEAKYFESGGESELPVESTEAESNEGQQEGQQPEQTEQQPEAKKDNLVPHQALHEQRERRKAAEKRARDLEIENAKFKERFSIVEKLYGDKAEAKGPPKPEEDIFGAFEHLSKGLETVNKQLADRDAATKQEAQRNELVGHYKNDAAKFTTANPDYKDAYNHLLGSRARELMALGYEDQAELERALQNEEISIATMAFEKGKSPAEVIYSLAKERGYKKADPKADTEAKLDTIERGSALNKSLSSASGASGDNEMTAESLLAMPNDEFEAWCNKNPAKAKRLMGA
jgi:hypothetical protein